jgi:hypothetical protein
VLFSNIAAKRVAVTETNDEILADIRQALKSGRYVFKQHAMQRVIQRSISVEDAKNALANGRITSERWNNEFQTTDFAIEGPALDQRQIRVVVAFERTSRGEYVVIITVIDLSGGTR